MFQVQVLVKNVYGTDTLYPVNKEAKALAELKGQRTLTLGDMKIARDGLGAELVVLNPTQSVLKILGPGVKVGIDAPEPTAA